jgi:hypothetical protein
VLLLGALAGCGGGEDAERYREKANAICRDGREAARRASGPDTIDGLAESLEELLRISRPFDRRFARLEPPGELRKDHDGAVADARRAERLFTGLIEDLRAAEGDEEGVLVLRRGLTPLARLIERSNERAARMGLEECDTDPIAPPGAPP